MTVYLEHGILFLVKKGSNKMLSKIAMVKLAVAVPLLIGVFLLTESLTAVTISGIVTLVGFKDYDLDRKERNNNVG